MYACHKDMCSSFVPHWIIHLLNKYLLSAFYVRDTPLDTGEFAVNKKDKNFCPHVNYSAGQMRLGGIHKHNTSVNYIQCM